MSLVFLRPLGLRPLKNFRANLKELMEDRGVNSEKLGKGIGINPSTIRRWFYDRDPKAESVRRVADYFGCSADFLFGLSPEFEPRRNNHPTNFYTRYTFLARAAGMTDHAVAKACGVGRGTVSKWKSGRMPELYILLQQCNLFGCGFEYLIGISDD